MEATKVPTPLELAKGVKTEPRATAYQLGLIRHSLGLPDPSEPRRSRKAPKPYRNHFAAEPDSVDCWDCSALVGEGAMEVGREIPGGLVYFHVTEAGARLVGTTLKDIPS